MGNHLRVPEYPQIHSHSHSNSHSNLPLDPGMPTERVQSLHSVETPERVQLLHPGALPELEQLLHPDAPPERLQPLRRRHLVTQKSAPAPSRPAQSCPAPLAPQTTNGCPPPYFQTNKKGMQSSTAQFNTLACDADCKTPN